MIDISVREKVMYIKEIKQRHGLSCDQICDIVSHNGEYISIHTVRRLTAPDSEVVRFRDDTVKPVYNALLNAYGAEKPVAPEYRRAFPHYDAYQYEKLIAMLKESQEYADQKCRKQQEIIEKQKKIIQILWHGLCEFGRSTEEYADILKFYEKERE